MTIDSVAIGRDNLTHAKAALDTATTDRERRMIRTNIAQLVAYLKAQGVEVPS